MAGASMNGIKARIKSVQSTMQITKAMELVATSKLRRAKEKAEATRPYLELLKSAIGDLLASAELSDSVFTREGEGGKTLFVVIAGDRGLAGGYNANVFRLTQTLAAGTDAVYLPIGRKALEYYRHREAELFSEDCEYASEISVGDALALGESICEAYSSGAFSSVTLVYTEFVSMITQTPRSEQLLPLKAAEASDREPEFETAPEELMSYVVPNYVGGIIRAALCEALASESGSRRSAMNAANKNAGEMIDTLMLKYNRARQAVITQEITEIVSGAEAL